jgi:hypothetical protein
MPWPQPKNINAPRLLVTDDTIACQALAGVREFMTQRRMRRPGRDESSQHLWKT